jgi:tetratricopeptide (TPR) repeat protein
VGKTVKLLLIFVFVLSLFQGHSISVNDLSQEAETAYTKGDFQEAAKLYQQMVDAGARNTEIYFNLGNAYYQVHDLGRSLLNYRRAAQFIPRDEDLRLNIARVRAQRVDMPNAYITISDQIAQWESAWLSNSEAGQIVLFLWWISCGCLAAYFLLPYRRMWARWGAIVSLMIFVFIGITTSVRVIVDNTYPPAIIVSSTASVLTGPDIQYMQIFELHAAGEVRIMERQNDWVHIQLPDLREGWVKADAIEVI